MGHTKLPEGSLLSTLPGPLTNLILTAISSDEEEFGHSKRSEYCWEGHGDLVKGLGLDGLKSS